MTITREQFQQLAPAATVEALFAPNDDNQPTIHRILAEHGITETAVVAQFLAACSLVSDGFTDFSRQVSAGGVADWLSVRAREWYKSDFNSDAREWDWLTIVDSLIAPIDFTEANQTLATVCAVLGIQDESEDYALEDHGAM
jgi:hypothetical protein